MNYADAIKKLQEFLNKEKYNILGYPYDPKEAKKLEPWFYMRKSKLGLPPACDEWTNMLKQKYDIAASMKKKILGQWAGPYYFLAFKADGLDVAGADAKLKDFESDMAKRFETIYADKKTNAYELNANSSIPSHMLVFIYENGVSDAIYQGIRNLRKENGSAAITIIDLANKKVDRGEGNKGWYMGTPNPKDLVKLIS